MKGDLYDYGRSHKFLALRAVKTFRSSYKIIHFISHRPTHISIAGHFSVSSKLFHARNHQSFYEVTKTLVPTHKACLSNLIKRIYGDHNVW